MSLEEDSGGKGGVSLKARDAISWHSCLCRALDDWNGVESEGCRCVWRLTGENEESSDGFEDGDWFCLCEFGLPLLNAELCWSACGWEKPEFLFGRVVQGEGVKFLDVLVGRISWEEVSEGDLC